MQNVEWSHHLALDLCVGHVLLPFDAFLCNFVIFEILHIKNAKQLNRLHLVIDLKHRKGQRTVTNLSSANNYLYNPFSIFHFVNFMNYPLTLASQ